MLGSRYLIVVICAVACANAQIVPLSNYCRHVHNWCTCEPQANLVRIYCRDEYAMILQIADTGYNIAMSYYASGDVHWLPRLNISQVAQFEFDAYNYWSDTFFGELLNTLGVEQVLSIQFRDRSVQAEIQLNADEDALVLDMDSQDAAGQNASTWLFSEVPMLESFKYESHQHVLSESIFHAFHNLTTLELRLSVHHLPSRLFSSIAHSLHTLSISNPYRLLLQPGVLQELRQLRNLTLQLARSPDNRSRRRLSPLFISMPQLEELHLSRATSYVNATMLRGSYNLRLIGINRNPDLSELPSELFHDQGNLTVLDLSRNGLAKLPMDLLNGLAKLQRLDLSNNRLANLSSELFTSLTSLSTLMLNQNPLTSLDSRTFGNVRSLNLLDMRGTQFYGIKLWMPFEALVCTNDDVCQYKSADWECDRQCICWVQRHTRQLLVDCRGAQLTELPVLPQTTLVQTTLKLRNNSISHLPDANGTVGYANVTKLSLADNQLSSLNAVQQLPSNLSLLDVRGNRITVFDQDFINYMTNSTMNLALGGNPLSCDCSALPLLGFVRAQPQRIQDMGDIYCSEWPDRPFQQLDVGELCPSYVLLVGCILGGLVIVICLFSVVYLIYQQELKIWLYNHNLCLWFVSEEELDKDKTYDAFISYSHKDEQLIGELLPKLETGLHAYRVCLHGRDWLVGDCIPEQIVRTVNDSKRVIIVLSQHFINSVWARMEFRIAYQATLQDKRKRIIIILYKELEHFEGIDSELRAYLKLNTYLKWGDPLFWSKLRYAMPHNRRVLKGQKKHAGPLI
ncbi:hypothetical protein AWZ03_010915 [Drosophila navojoa]|uniref:TIR domain-containing protein n=1 Tax=Drosophila navojoa TaxID=7232 RepID=A0A484B3M6_DRONA|nr:protein toll [Drosophila navojoa]TDG42670.1 hypothetical protein AWZ03_010915 [Drosophila navojoa]